MTYEDVTNIDSVGLITARNGIVVGSGITLSKDGDGFFTGVVTATSYAGSGANLTGIDTDLVSDTSPQLGGDLASNGNDITMADTDKVILGTGSDLLIYHQSTQNFIRGSATASPLYIDCCENLNIRHLDTDGSNAENMIRAIGDGAVELYYDNTKRFETTSSGATVTGQFNVAGVLKFDNNVNSGLDIRFEPSTNSLDFVDNVKARFGTGDDIEIYHDGTNNIFDHVTGSSTRFMHGSEKMLVMTPDSHVELYYDNSKKFNTTSAGANIVGNVIINETGVTSGKG